MKAYVITSGAIFGVLAIAHLLRIAMENRHLATEPVFVLITLASAALCIWAWRVLRRLNR
jgi:membrane associated rhomboid family serine protease